MRLIVAVVVMVVSFSVVSGTAIVLARQQPLPEALAVLHFDICEPPCWNNITPGVTTEDEALKRINALYPSGHYQTTIRYIYDGVTTVDILRDNVAVTTIHLYRMDNQIVGEVGFDLSAFSGDPVSYAHIYRLFGIPSNVHLPDYNMFFVSIYYALPTATIFVSIYCGTDSRSCILYQPAHYLKFSNSKNPVSQYLTTKWRGFYPVRKYLQLICIEHGCD